MSIENLRSALPSYAKDMNLNLSAMTRLGSLTEQQLWGSLLATAAATKVDTVLVETLEEAKQHLSETAVEAALGAATIMGMNNVFYRTRGFLEPEYDDQRAGLRMQIIGKNGGVEKLDFEMYALAVSAVNGCSHCVAAHEHTLREEGATKEQVNDLIRIAATMAGVAQGIQIAEALAA
ncbi:MAG: carboxymuconolactone decarboxylase family protein [Rothia sp. (in: high G+C Gram-positive bacteria)]|uniref:carboxymuconolactone decarboxylase family protein n=1 Tax=Rothia sp. (in: high G+C Gram-positive bacteria) TaxID=1885016 RepID=UPI0026DF8FC5|nr:carboxymuconolactone decarboxylase family protein [Rothia sp. (in: high G+C Gram-positive bacteria)]MDO5750475.1 carboxymuconolactone decarboxylase family protein [Rothia sp. (in: high G+C Gram-positive bacteria)]